MCLDPLSLATMAIGGIGSAVSASERNASNRAMVDARNKATTDEFARQDGYQQQSSGIFDGVLNKFSGPAQTQGLADAKAGAGAAIRGNQPTNVGSILLGGAASPQAVAAQDNTISDAFARGGERATALGNLTGYDRQGTQDRLNLTDSGRGLDTISNFSQGSASLLPLEREVAGNNAYKPPSGLGDLLSFVGNVGSFKGGEGTLPTKSIFGAQKAALPALSTGRWFG